MVLQAIVRTPHSPDHILHNIAYSFAKTPLKAAQAPLAAASGIQGSLPIVVLFDGWGWGWGSASGIRGSASVSMAVAEGVGDGDGGWRVLRRAICGGSSVFVIFYGVSTYFGII